MTEHTDRLTACDVWAQPAAAKATCKLQNSRWPWKCLGPYCRWHNSIYRQAGHHNSGRLLPLRPAQSSRLATLELSCMQPDRCKCNLRTAHHATGNTPLVYTYCMPHYRHVCSADCSCLPIVCSYLPLLLQQCCVLLILLLLSVMEYAPGTAPLVIASHLHNNAPSRLDTIKHMHAAGVPLHPSPLNKQSRQPPWIQHVLHRWLASARVSSSRAVAC
jgi:hypothetical protein